ncbi:MAG TPA: hypothetical protein VFV35_04940 [Acidimicrobiales bacterium]|nr:hypothetical protein [Acidimicrobiales bacterium]
MTSRTRDDQGSTLVIAVIVMTILATLTVALQARTLSNLRYMRHAQDFDAALAAADAGLAKAVYRIENGLRVDRTESGYVNESNASKGTYKFHADNHLGVANPTEFIVSVKGTVGKASHAIRAKVTRDALFPYALFGYQNLRLDGSTDAGRLMQFSVGGTAGLPVRVGSNGMLTCNGPVPNNVQLRSAGGFSGCPSTQWKALDTKQPRLALEPPPSPAQACPWDGKSFGSNNLISTLFNASMLLGGKEILGLGLITALLNTLIATPVRVIDGQNGVPYVCRQDVDLEGIIEVINPPVIIYVLNDIVSGQVSPTACNSLDLRGSQINATSLSVGILRKARDFQIYKSGSCPLRIDDGNTIDLLGFNGILYAPDSTLEVNGGKLFHGSIMVGELRVNGGPNFFVNWDDDLGTYYGKQWRVSRYAEVSPAELPPELSGT